MPYSDPEKRRANDRAKKKRQYERRKDDPEFRAKKRERSLATHAKRQETDPAYRAARVDYSRAYRLRTKFNLTIEEYDQMLEAQGGVCAVCGNPPKKQRLAVDHNHKTGLVRGLLCWGCNTAIGKFRDDAEKLVKAAEYVTHPPAVRALGREVYGVKGRVTNKRKKRSTRRKEK